MPRCLQRVVSESLPADSGSHPAVRRIYGNSCVSSGPLGRHPLVGTCPADLGALSASSQADCSLLTLGKVDLGCPLRFFALFSASSWGSLSERAIPAHTFGLT